MIFDIIKNIYTRRDSVWINDIDTTIQPYTINMFLSMFDGVKHLTSFLDKYVYMLDAKHWIALAWSIMPKYQSAPFVPYIKKQELEEEYGEILKKIKKRLELSENDYDCCKQFFIEEIKKDKNKWFKMLGMNKQDCEKYDVAYGSTEEKRIGKSGLELWGM